MILSVSRRTDIPNHYSEWFLNRIREGYLYVRNPMNPRQVSKILLSPQAVDCIVFWTKNPEPLLSRLDELSDWPSYFQFTLTGYGNDMEPGIPHKKKYMIPLFRKLSREIGSHRVIWRYDPIIFTDRYTPGYHLKAFMQIAAGLHGYTEKCVISFVDLYSGNLKDMRAINSRPLTGEGLMGFCREIARIADSFHIKVASCAEKTDLSSCGIEHNRCIDRELIEKITGCRIRAGKDKNQRKECGCLESIDVGAYHTCKNGCLYCYAGHSPENAAKNNRPCDAGAPLLCGRITEDDKITERNIRSWRDGQMTLPDM